MIDYFNIFYCDWFASKKIFPVIRIGKENRKSIRTGKGCFSSSYAFLVKISDKMSKQFCISNMEKTKKGSEDLLDPFSIFAFNMHLLKTMSKKWKGK